MAYTGLVNVPATACGPNNDCNRKNNMIRSCQRYSNTHANANANTYKCKCRRDKACKYKYKYIGQVNARRKLSHKLCLWSQNDKNGVCLVL